MTAQATPNVRKAVPARRRVAAQRITAEALSEQLELLPNRSESKFGINIKVRESGTLFRLAPIRDPHQPRLWCVSIRRCAPGGMLDTDGPIWIDRPGQSRPEIAELVETIREDIGTWLATPNRRELCHWLLTATPAPSVASAAGLSEQPLR